MGIRNRVIGRIKKFFSRKRNKYEESEKHLMSDSSEELYTPGTGLPIEGDEEYVKKYKAIAEKLLDKKMKMLLKEYKKIVKDSNLEIEKEFIREFEKDWKSLKGQPESKEEYLSKLEDRLKGIEEALPYDYKPSKIRKFYNWLIERRSEAPSYAFHALPFIIGAILSYVIFGVFFPNWWLFIGAFLISFSLLFPKEGETGYLKALFIFLGILSLWWGMQAIHKLIALIFLFIGYVSLSPRLTSEEYHGYETTIIVFRLGLGGLIALSPFFVFFGADILALSLILIGIGFFVLAFPEHEETAQRGIVKITIIGKEHGDAFALFSGILVLAGILLGLSQLIASFGWLSFTTIFFLLLGFGAVITAFSVHGHHRGEAGFPLYIMLLLTVTTAYPDVLGSAVFGPWWPQVSTTLQTVIEPINTGIAQMQQGMNDVWLMMTCPQCYYEEQIRKQQEQSQAAGSVYSVEVRDFRVFSNQLDPAQPLTGIITLENRGEGEAKDIEVYVKKPEIYVKTGRKYEYKSIGTSITVEGDCGSLEDFIDSSYDYRDYFVTFQETCYKSSLLPGEKFQVSFSYGSGQYPWSATFEYEGGEASIDQCKCVREDAVSFDCKSGLDNCKLDACTRNLVTSIDASNVEASPLCLPPENVFGFSFREGECEVQMKSLEENTIVCYYDCTLRCSENDHLIYKFGGEPIRIGFNYSFSYTANVSLQITAMDENVLKEKMKEGKIVQKEVMSTYTGGPVKVSLWTQYEPVKCGGKIFMSFTLRNEGTGKILSKSFKGTSFTIKSEDATFENIGQQVWVSCSKNENGDTIECSLKRDIAKGDYARVTFWATPNCENQKTLTFVGYVNYRYGNERWKTINILPAPFT